MPVFHPCVRLARWCEHGELSFVPPDGRFVLAGYEVDLIDASAASPFDAQASNLNIPASIDVRTGLGPAGLDFEVRLMVNHRFAAAGGGIGGGGAGGSNSGPTAAASLSNNLGRPGVGGLRSHSGDYKGPVMEDVVVTVPIPVAVRSITDMRPSKGEAHWSPGDVAIEWKLSGKEMANIGPGGAALRCSMLGATDDNDDGDGSGLGSNGIKAGTYDYDEDTAGGAYQSSAVAPENKSVIENRNGSSGDSARRVRQNAVLMPTSASLSFSVKGWLASGLKVDSLIIDTKKSKGIGEGVRPYKGVKYLTVSRGGVEVRC